MGGQELRTCYAEASESGKIAVRGGIANVCGASDSCA